MKRLLLIGAGILGVAVLAGSLLLYLNRAKIASYAMDRALSKVEEEVLLRLSDHATVTRAKADFAALHERLQDGSVPTEDIKDLAAMFYTSYRSGTLDSIQVHQLITQVHKLTRHSEGAPPVP